MVTGLVELHNRKDQVVAVSIVSRKIPRSLTLKKRGITKLEFLLTINYSEPISRETYSTQKDIVEKEALEAMRKALLEAEHPVSGFGDENKMYNFKRQHTQVWQALWSTGFEISSSLAEDSINGKFEPISIIARAKRLTNRLGSQVIESMPPSMRFYHNRVHTSTRLQALPKLSWILSGR